MGKIKLAFRRSVKGIFELLVFFPILLPMAIYLEPFIGIGEYFLYMYILCLCGTIIRGVFNVRSRWLEIPVGIGIILLITYINRFSCMGVIVFSIAGIISFFRGILFMEAHWEEIFPRQMWWLALVFYMLGGFLYSRIITVKDYMSHIIICGFIQVIISLFMLNSRQLGDATLVTDKKPVVPSSIRWQNRILLIITFIIITIIASFNTIKDFVKKAIRQVFIWIMNILMAINSLLMGGKMSGENLGGPPELPFQGEIAPPNPILDLIFQILGIVLLTIGMVFLIYIIYRGFKKLVSIISAWLRDLFEEKELYEDSYGYIDEKESLIDLSALRNNYRQKLKDWLEDIMARQPKWRDLKNNIQRIRYMYMTVMLKYLKEGYRYKNSMTPNEIEEDIHMWCGEEDPILKEIVPIYNRARYGRVHIDDDEIERIYKLYKNI